jgi:hypothetical protein
MDTSGDWSDDDSLDTVTEGVFKQHIADSLMATDHLVGEAVFGKRSGSKATKGKGNMARASRASATPTPSSSSARGTTPLSYASMAINRSSLAASSPAPSSPSPKTHRLSPHNERFISAFKTKTELFPQHGPVPVFTALSERVLDFIHLFFFFFFLYQWRPRVGLYSSLILGTSKEMGGLNRSRITYLRNDGLNSTVLRYEAPKRLLQYRPLLRQKQQQEQ